MIVIDRSCDEHKILTYMFLWIFSTRSCTERIQTMRRSAFMRVFLYHTGIFNFHKVWRMSLQEKEKRQNKSYSMKIT